MAPLTKAVVRESNTRDAGRNIVVIIGPGSVIGFRLKGTRKVYETTVQACYRQAVATEVAYLKKQKALKKTLNKQAKAFGKA